MSRRRAWTAPFLDFLLDHDLPLWAPPIVGVAVYILGSVAAGAAALTSFLPAYFGILLTWLVTASWTGRWRRKHLVEGATTLAILQSMDWRSFERLVGEGFRRQGYAVSENLDEGPDGGVDLELRRKGKRYLVQCKLWKGMIGVAQMRELWGVVASEGADGAIFVTSSTFTPEAEQFARAQKGRYQLFDGNGLVSMLHPVLLEQMSAPKNDITPKSRAGTQRAPKCQRCGKVMFLGQTADGTATTWVCSNFERCRTVQFLQPATSASGEPPNP